MCFRRSIGFGTPHSRQSAETRQDWRSHWGRVEKSPGLLWGKHRPRFHQGTCVCVSLFSYYINGTGTKFTTYEAKSSKICFLIINLVSQVVHFLIFVWEFVLIKPCFLSPFEWIRMSCWPLWSPCTQSFIAASPLPHNPLHTSLLASCPKSAPTR